MLFSLSKAFRRCFSTTGTSLNDAQHNAQVALNQQLLRLNTFPEVESFIQSSTSLNAMNCATAFARLAKTKTPTTQVKPFTLKKLYQLTSSNSLTSRDVSMICHSIAKAQLADQIPDFIVTHLRESSPSPFSNFDSHALSLTLWAFGKLKQEDEFVFKSASQELVDNRDLMPFPPLHVTNILYAFAKVKYRSPKLLRKVALTCEKRHYQDFAPGHVANFCFAFAELSPELAALVFAKLAPTVLRQVNKKDLRTLYSFQDLTMICLAFAKASYKDDAFFLRVSKELLEREGWNFSQVFGNQGLANLAWAFAKLSVVDKPLFDRIASVVLDRNDFSRPVFIAQLAWSFSKVDIKHPALFSRLTFALNHLEFLQTFSLKELIHISFAFAKQDLPIGREERQMLQKLSQVLDQFDESRLTSMDLAEGLWSLVKLHETQAPVVKKWVSELERRCQHDDNLFSVRECTDLVWCLGILNSSPSLLARLQAQLVTKHQQQQQEENEQRKRKESVGETK